MCFTRSESLQKASWWAPLKCSARGCSSFCLCWVGSPGWDMGSPSPKVSNSTSHLGECCCLVLVECVAVAGLLEQEGEGMGSLNLIVSCGVPIRKQVRDMFPVTKCMRHISTPRALLGEAWRAAPQAHRKVWWAHFSSLMASSSRVCMVSSWTCCSLEVCAALADSAFLTAVVQITSASLVEAEWVASTSLMAAT